jgi:hypothetical protein
MKKILALVSVGVKRIGMEYGFPRMRLLACRTEADLRLLEGRG